jgi:hypothetical protein
MMSSSFLSIHSINLRTNFILLRVIIELPQKKTQQELRLFYHEFLGNLSNKTKINYFYKKTDRWSFKTQKEIL